MGISFPKTPGAVAGWMMLAFVVAIALRTEHRNWHIPAAICVTGIVFGVALSILIRNWKAKIVALIVVSFLSGWWRVELAPVPKFQMISGRLTMMRPPGDGKESILAQAHAWVTARIAAELPPDEAALVAGIIYGGDGLSSSQRKLFSQAGLMHIVAVSGSNVTIVVQVLTMAILSCGLRRRQAFGLTSFGLLLFVGFVGFSASVMRAVFMAWLALFARELGRIPSPFRLLLVAATILLIINPWQLLFDAGFALSFLAMWGVLAWSPIFEEYFSWLPERFGIRSTCSMTFAATLMTAPYTAWMFQSLPLAGLGINMLALPLVPFIMGWGALLALWGPWPGNIVVRTATYGLVRLLEIVAGLTKLAPWLNIPMTALPFSVIAAIYSMIVYFYGQLRIKSRLSPSNGG